MKLELDPERLREALGRVPAGAWSLPSQYAVTRVHHGYRQMGLVAATRPQAYTSLFGFALDQFAPVHTAWLSWIEPGGFIVPHRDAGPWRQRWQVPIAAAGTWHDDDGVTRPVDGRPFQVTHWLPHAVVNRSDRPRVHLVIDRDRWLGHPAEPFTTWPVPDEMRDLAELALASSNERTGP